MTPRWTVAAATAAVLLGGCTSGDPAPEATATPPAPLRACVVPTPGAVEVAPARPLGFAGYDVALLRHVADELGRDLELVEVSFDLAVAGVPTADGRCQLVAGALPDDGTVAPPLEPSVPYRQEQLLVVARARDEAVPAFTAETPLGHVRGTRSRAVALELTPQARAFPSLLDAAAALRAGTVAAVLAAPDEVAQVRDVLRLARVVGTVPTGAGIVLAYANRTDPQVVDDVDAALGSWRDSAAAEEAAAQWLTVAPAAGT